MVTVGTAVELVSNSNFRKTFEVLTGHKPYPWQESLFSEFLKDSLPADINLPTGAGKTSIIAIWLIALCHQASVGAMTLPRRLIWVVNRRVVVDQATDDAVEIRERLIAANVNPELRWLRNQLQPVGVSQDEILAISTLRGEREDNKEWSKDPSRPAIIIGTVDMIGSRLLFSGYGDGPYWRAQHVGLLGHDGLIVNDEAHLSPAFAKLLCSIESLQRGSLKPLRTVRLSATYPSGRCWPRSLDADRADERFRKVFEAQKKLVIQTVPSSRIEQTMIDLAAQSGAGRTLVFVTEPEKARKIAGAIRKKVSTEARKHVLTLTGTMRGFERDQLIAKDEFKPFAGRMRPAEDHWLVATSAGEVGINISSDRLITGCDTLDHLIQRFGRLNRFGETNGVAHLIASDKEKEERAEALKVLTTRLSENQTDGYDISPRALFGFPLDKTACSPEPRTAALHPWHVDVWSQTSLGAHPARPQVEPWLHGQEDNLPETYVAWREYTDTVANPQLVTDDDRQEVFEEYPLLAHEQLREPTIQLLKKLKELFEADDRTIEAIRRKSDGSVDAITLPKLRTNGRPIDIRDERSERAAIRELAYSQLILPPGCGQPRDGMFHPEWHLDGESADSSENAPVYDLSGAILRDGELLEGVQRESRASYRAEKQEDESYLLHRFGGFPGVVYPPEELKVLTRPKLETFARQRGFRFLLELLAKDDEGESSPETILLFFGPARKAKNASQQVLSVSTHNDDVSKTVQSLAKALRLEKDLMDALAESGSWHDLGKAREIWQRAAGNWNAETRQKLYEHPVAKPVGIMRGRQLAGFRHELASILDAKRGLDLNPDARDLVLHLIAAHHGHGRPCFRAKTYDREHLSESAQEALETVKRFGRVQRKYGAWGLAYIEAILRAADAIASDDAPEQSPNA